MVKGVSLKWTDCAPTFYLQSSLVGVSEYEVDKPKVNPTLTVFKLKRFRATSKEEGSVVGSVVLVGPCLVSAIIHSSHDCTGKRTI